MRRNIHQCIHIYSFFNFLKLCFCTVEIKGNHKNSISHKTGSTTGIVLKLFHSMHLVSRIILIPIYYVSRASLLPQVVHKIWDQITISRSIRTKSVSYYHRCTQFSTHILMAYSDFFRKILPKTLSLAD